MDKQSFIREVGNSKLVVVLTSIFDLEVDAMVNPANCSLMGGGGLDGAFHQLTNGKMRLEPNLKNGCEVGEVRTTGSYGLSCKYVIHAVGPSYEDGVSGESALLTKCYRSIFKEAGRLGCRTIAIPALGTGIFRYPVVAATEIAIRESLGAAHQFDSIFFPVTDVVRYET